MTASQHDRPLLALLIRLIGVFGFGIMAVFIKLATERGLHLAELVFWRQAVSVPVIFAVVMMSSGIASLKTERPKAHLLRSLYGICGMTLNFAAVMMLPLAEATALSFSAPIFAVILSAILLKESIGVWRWSSVLVGFAGILIITQPGGNAISSTGVIVALAGALMIGLISIQIRDLSRTDNPLTIVFWFSCFTTILVLPFMLYFKHDYALMDWLLLLGIGLTGTFAQSMITYALRFGKVSSVIIMDYSGMLWAALFGWLVFAVVPDLPLWIGAPIVIAAGMTIAWRERVVAKRQSLEQGPSV